jgi:hypothetical protein
MTSGVEVDSSAGSVRPSHPVAPSTRARALSLALRLVVALGWVATCKVATVWLAQQPVLSLLAGTSVSFVSASVLFGWVGVAAAVAVQLTALELQQGLGGIYPWASTAAYALAGALAYGVFRYVPRLRRDFEGGWTFAWFCAAAAAGGIISPIVISAATGEGQILRQVAVWSRSTIVSVWVLAPPLILLGRRWLTRAIAPLAGEPQARAPRRVALVLSALPGEAGQVVGVETREPSATRDILLGLAAVAAITAGKLVFAGGYSPAGAWWNVLYLVVIWWEARRLRLPGALLTTGAVAVGTLLGAAAAGPAAGFSADETLAIYAQILALWLVAALLGYGAEREGHLLDGLAELNARLAQDLQRVVQALTGAIEAKDEYTGGHQQRVQAFALDVGRRLGLSARELELLQIASTLHDIGKIAVPEAILNKPGALDEEERAVIQRHPEIGARMLSRIDGLREAAPFVLHHQERWDGHRDGPFPGYPAGLAGESIPLGARIISVVDCFDAMTTDRPYRRALGLETALAVLRRERGQQVDPRVVDTFIDLLEQRPWH